MRFNNNTNFNTCNCATDVMFYSLWRCSIHSYTQFWATGVHCTCSSLENHRSISFWALSTPSLPWQMFLKRKQNRLTAKFGPRLLRFSHFYILNSHRNVWFLSKSLLSPHVSKVISVSKISEFTLVRTPWETNVFMEHAYYDKAWRWKLSYEYKGTFSSAWFVREGKFLSSQLSELLTKLLSFLFFPTETSLPIGSLLCLSYLKQSWVNALQLTCQFQCRNHHGWSPAWNRMG